MTAVAIGEMRGVRSGNSLRLWILGCAVGCFAAGVGAGFALPDLVRAAGRTDGAVDPDEQYVQQMTAEGLLARMLHGLSLLDPIMIEAVRRARTAGLSTALLSNSWGEHYPDALWDNLFDVVVISGRVGMRKPEPAIYEHTAAALGLPPGDCLLVDDIERNVVAATAAGMRAVLHRTVEETLERLEEAFGVALR